jgi:hypothetical protein
MDISNQFSITIIFMISASITKPLEASSILQVNSTKTQFKVYLENAETELDISKCNFTNMTFSIHTNSSIKINYYFFSNSSEQSAL